MQDLATQIFAKDSWQTPRNARTLRAYMALQNREIGERIAGLRKAKGNPPQEVVAQKLEIANRSYQAWEAGDTKPSWRNLSKLAKFYGVTEEWILLGDGAVKASRDNGIESQMDRIEKKLDELLSRTPETLPVPRVDPYPPELEALVQTVIQGLRALQAQQGPPPISRDAYRRRKAPPAAA